MQLVTTTVPIYEKDGQEVKGLPRPELRVESHWNDSDLAVLVMDGHPKVTIVRADLERALQNAGNRR